MIDLFGASITEIPYYYTRSYELDGMRVVVSRTGYTAELGYEIIYTTRTGTPSSCGTPSWRRAGRTI